MNLYLHNLAQSNVINFDALTLPEEEAEIRFDSCKSTISGNVNKDSIRKSDLNTTKTELLFLKYM
jgi:hypothetical protein